MLHPNPRPNWWQRLRARRRADGGPDAADMGTTFGLEMSLSAAATENDDQASRAAARARRRLWWLRSRGR
jgi:hypothetical protein